MPSKISVTFDNNIWVSFVIGGQIQQLQNILDNPNIEILTCQKILDEFNVVEKRPKMQKIFKPERVLKTREIIEILLVPFIISSQQMAISRDPKDDYVLNFSFEYSLNYLVTGDKDLLVLEQYHDTRILTFSNFIKELEILKVI